jgi:hypothetical protein
MDMGNRRQSRRIGFEKELVPGYFPGAQFNDIPHGTHLDFWTGRNGRRHDYQLRVELPPDYPHKEPGLFVQSPRDLPTHDGTGVLNGQGASHDWHIHNNDEDGRVKVCYTSDWDASMNCVVVLLCGIIWIDAYENYLTTGETIAQYIERLKDELGD